MSLAKQIHQKVGNKEFSMNDIYLLFQDQKKTTLRGRIYDNVNKLFKKVGKNAYIVINPDTNAKAIVAQGDGLDLSEIPNESIDAIITDHPWDDSKSNKGSNRNFVDGYSRDVFCYSPEHFKEKARVLKNGGFLVENLPEENSNNFEYLYQIKKMAIEAGFKYFAQVPWVKGNLVNNTGRKSKNREVLLFMTKGEPRKLRPDRQRSLKYGEERFMSGASRMLPVEYNYQPERRKNHPAEKPVSLLRAIINDITMPGETVLDQFGGSLNIVLAALSLDRNCICYEKDRDYVLSGLERMSLNFQNLGDI